MSKVRLGDVVYRYKEFVDKDNTDLLYYIGGEHFDNATLTINRKGIIKGSTIGPAFNTKFYPGDVLLMSRNPHLRKAAIVDFEGICSDVSYVIRTRDEKKLLQSFIPLLFQSDIFWRFAEKNKKGSTNFFLNWSDFERFEFELPTIEEQRKLSNVLWSINNTKESYKKMIQNSEQLIKAKFIKMFGDLGEDPYNFGLTTLDECTIINPRKPKDIEDDTLVSFVPMPSVSEHGDIDGTILKEYKEVKKGFTYFENNDVLFAKITPCMENGKGCIVRGMKNGIGMGSTEFHVIRPIPNKTNSYWIYAITMIDSFRIIARKNMTGTGGQLRVPSSYLKTYKIALPPYELQQEFACFFENVMTTKERLIIQIEKTEQIYKKITTKYLSSKED